MNTKNITRTFLPALLLAAVACDDGAELPLSAAAPNGDNPAVTEAVSSLALDVERAERMLDRGESAEEARTLLLRVLEDPATTEDERTTAVLVLSRAHEALGQVEPAIAVLEAEMARHVENPSWGNKGYRERLRELLTGSPTADGLEPHKKPDAVRFARFLSRYFPAADDGAVAVKMFVVGNGGRSGAELGTFDVGAGIRATLEDDCPLCTERQNIHTSRSQSDWTMIPVSESSFADALVVVYFDLGNNRIPARYEAHLPMKVAAIEELLEAGKSFVVATERAGAPPVVLLAAPRTALLEDVEKHLATLERLPTGLEVVDVPPDARSDLGLSLTATWLEVVDVPLDLRPSEIQAVIRGQYFAGARACYESVLAGKPRAVGKVTLGFEIQPDGRVASFEVKVNKGDLTEATFEQCLADAMAEVRFPATPAAVTVTYPIVFSPH